VLLLAVSLDLAAPIIKAVKEQGYDTPSPIQKKAIPIALKGHDVMAAAQTGTGKTAGFTLPILDRLSQGNPAKANQARALILTPTRELAAQVHENITLYGKYLPLKSNVVFGGVKINPQMMKLRKGTDVLVATPGRLLDLVNQRAIRFNELEVLVLDEADRMLDMGFIHDIKKIINLLPKKRQTLMFSATFSKEIRTLAKQFLYKPQEVSVSPENVAAKTVKQTVHPTDKAKKSFLLKHLVSTNDWYQVLVFVRTKHGGNKLTKQLNSADIKAAAIHGDKSQAQRTKALAQFKSGKLQVLVATDIAARGIDINELPYVINYDLPQVSEDYVHRIGRTGRAGATGEAISFVSADEAKQLRDIERLIGKQIERIEVEGFEATHHVPVDAPKAVKKKHPQHKFKKKFSGKKRSKKRTTAKTGAGSNKKQAGNAKPGGRRRRPAANKMAG